MPINHAPSARATEAPTLTQFLKPKSVSMPSSTQERSTPPASPTRFEFEHPIETGTPLSPSQKPLEYSQPSLPSRVPARKALPSAAATRPTQPTAPANSSHQFANPNFVSSHARKPMAAPASTGKTASLSPTILVPHSIAPIPSQTADPLFHPDRALPIQTTDLPVAPAAPLSNTMPDSVDPLPADACPQHPVILAAAPVLPAPLPHSAPLAPESAARSSLPTATESLSSPNEQELVRTPETELDFPVLTDVVELPPKIEGGPVQTVSFRGFLGPHCTAALSGVCAAAKFAPVRIDLSAITGADSVGISLLLATLLTIHDQGGRYQLIGSSVLRTFLNLPKGF